MRVNEKKEERSNYYPSEAIKVPKAIKSINTVQNMSFMTL